MTDPVLIAIAVVEQAGSFLVGQRPDNVPLAGLWEFPGGKVEPGELPEHAAIRECLEETGMAVEIVASYPEHIQQYDYGSVRLNFFACRPRDPRSIPIAPWRWVARAMLVELQFPEGNRDLIELLTST